MNSTFLPASFLTLFSRIRLGCSLLLLGALVPVLADAQVTLGDAFIDGVDDNASGGVYIYTNTFGQAGTADTWSFFDDDNDSINRSVTPLLFQKINSSTFQLTAVGTTVMTAETGTQSGIAFGLIAGSGTVASDYTFGFTDRQLSYIGSGTAITTVGQNTGVIDYQSSGGIWAFVPGAEGAFDIILGQNYVIGAADDSDDSTVSLFSSANRQYAAQFTTSAVPEPAAFGSLLGVSVLLGASLRRRRRVAL